MRHVLAFLLALTLLPGSVSAGPCNPGHPCPTPSPTPSPSVNMGRVYYTGFETGSGNAEHLTGAGALSGTLPTFDTTTVRTGTRSLRINLASGQQGFFTPGLTRSAVTTWARFYLYIATMPTVTRHIAGSIAANFANLRLTSAGKIEYWNDTTLVMNGGGVTLSTGQWYMIEYRAGSAAGVVMRINGVDVGASVTPATSFTGVVGNNNPGGAEASALDIYVDDFTVDDAGWPGEGGVVLLLPTADSARGTGWVGGGGGTTNLFDAVNNTPPVGVADTGTNTSQIRNATAAANSNYDATMTTYTAAGVPDGAIVNSVVPLIWTAAPVSTGAKQGTVGIASNPTVANVALAAGGTAGAFWSGAAAATYVTGWKLTRGTMTSSPAVTLGTAPVMRITQVTSSTRIADVCFMGIYVDYTPGAVVAGVPHTSPYPQLLAH